MTGPWLVFSWDPAKDRSNIKKHGVRFAEAAGVFADPLAQSEYDDRFGERWRTIGEVDSDVLVIIHTYEEDADHGIARISIRIISARFATKAEIREYRNVPS